MIGIGLTRRGVSTGLVLSGTTAMASNAAAARHGSRMAVQSTAEAVTAHYVERLRSAGLAPPAPAPAIVLATTPLLSNYSNAKVTLPVWADTPPQLRSLVASLAAGSGMTSEQLFDEIFNWFIIPHELTHWYEDALDWRAVHLDHYATELRCNRVAVAYWREDPANAARLKRLMEAVAKAVVVLPSPVPPGEDPVRYFNTNYATLATTAAYGWYQFRLFAAAWELREQSNLTDLWRAMHGSRPAPLLTVDAFFDAFSKGDWDAAAACCAQPLSIIDNTPPFQWSGPNSFQDWLDTNRRSWTRFGISQPAIKPSDPLRVLVQPGRAYVVVPAVETFLQRGAIQSQPGLFTFGLTGAERKWLITAFAWTDDQRRPLASA